MTNKEFFVKTLEDEQKKFRDVIEALPDEKQSHKVHDKSREAGSLAGQLAVQWAAISNIVTKGNPMEGDFQKGKQSKSEMLATFDENMAELQKNLSLISDNRWENDMAKMDFPGGAWEDKKYNMAWGFLFDAIHHRGQLSTFLRAMGEKVPSIYGPTADTN